MKKKNYNINLTFNTNILITIKKSKQNRDGDGGENHEPEITCHYFHWKLLSQIFESIILLLFANFEVDSQYSQFWSVEMRLVISLESLSCK